MEVELVVERRIVPAQIYRFRQCPTDYLYEWQRPLRGEPLVKVLGRLNRLRTVVMIVSEAGAMSPLLASWGARSVVRRRGGRNARACRDEDQLALAERLRAA